MEIQIDHRLAYSLNSLLTTDRRYAFRWAPFEHDTIRELFIGRNDEKMKNRFIQSHKTRTQPQSIFSSSLECRVVTRNLYAPMQFNLIHQHSSKMHAYLHSALLARNEWRMHIDHVIRMSSVN